MLKRSFALTLTVLAVAAVLLASSLARPVAADHTTNRVHSCRTIDQSGSYVLDRNIEATGDCLVVATSHVTIDLAGYTITGNESGTGVLTLAGFLNGITVRNGSITNFTQGIFLRGRHNLIEQVRVSNNLNFGIQMQGSSPAGNTVRNSIASDNGRATLASGIAFFGFGNSVIGNVANNNGSGTGIQVDCPSTIVNNVATGNTIDIFTFPTSLCTRLGNSPLP